MFNNLRELILNLPTEEMCREYLVQQRWNGKPVCPYCGCGKSYRIEKGKRFKCGNKECYKKYSVTVGTVFEASNIPLVKWLTAVYLITAHKKGISSYQLGKDISVTQKTAWFMLHRIRELMRPKELVKLDNIVEADEVYIGGKVTNMSKTKRTKLREAGETFKTKYMVMGMIERGGELKLIALGKDNSAGVIKPVIRNNVDRDAVVITDGHESYKGLHDEFAGHEVVNHKEQEYVRDKVFHTNTIEGAFSLLKRSILGIYHQVTPRHLSRYCDETMYRYNFRDMKDTERFILSLRKVEGRLTYKELTAKPAKEKIVIIDTKQSKRGKKRAVIQFKNGEFVAQYPSIMDAANMTGCKASSIGRVLAGRKNTTKGFEWKYA